MEGIYNDGEAVVKGVGFADKLKILGARSLGFLDFTDAECIDYMDRFKEDGDIDVLGGFNRSITGREYLQNLGNEGRKVFGDTFWIDHVLPNPIHQDSALWEIEPIKMVEYRYPGVDCLCVTDVRYDNEAERIRDLGGVVWEVIRPGLKSDGHPSEQPLPRELVDHQILNDGDLRDLEREVERAMDTLA